MNISNKYMFPALFLAVLHLSAETNTPALSSPAPVPSIPEETMQTPEKATELQQHSPVHILKIHGEIEGALFKSFMRGLDKAENEHAGAIIIDMNTPGGRLDVTEKIVRRILKCDIPVYTFVNNWAISAGAIISLSTDKIFMTSDARIGDAMPILGSPFGGGKAVDDNLKPKIMSPTLAMIRMICQHTGYNSDMAEAMVDPDKTFSINGKEVCGKGELITFTAMEASQIDNSTGKPLLCSGIVKDVDEVITLLGLTPSKTVEVQTTPGESLGRFFSGSMISGLLLSIGLIGIYLEIKTPGFGIPGIVGISALFLWFMGHRFADFSGIFEFSLLITGLILLWLEVFVIPGFGIAGTTGIILIFISIFASMVKHDPSGSWFNIPTEQIQHAIATLGTASIITAAGCILLTMLLPNTPLFRKLTLSSASSASVTTAPDGKISDRLVGQKGVTITNLRPSGTAMIDGKRVDVITRGRFLTTDTPIVVTAFRGNHVEVKKA